MPAQIESHLSLYVEAIGHRPDLGGGVALLRREFIPGLLTLARHGMARRQDLLAGEVGLELLHETCHALLDGQLGPEPKPGDLLRLVGRIAYARLRRDTRRVVAFNPEGLSTRPALHGSAKPEALAVFQHLLPFVFDLRFRKSGGGVHFGRLSEALSIPPKRLRRELRSLGTLLGRGPAYENFWLARLGECLTEMLYRHTEEALPDLVPTRRRRRLSHRRLLRILARLSYCSPPGSARDALRLVRGMTRRNEYPRTDLRDAALLLVTDPFLIHLVEAEWLRSVGDSRGALQLLDAVVARPGRSPLPPARRVVLSALVRARCEERLGRFSSASNTLEPSASVRRKDPLLTYNRLVLAKAAGFDDRAREARRDLAETALEPLNPLLRCRIRLELARHSR